LEFAEKFDFEIVDFVFIGVNDTTNKSMFELTHIFFLANVEDKVWPNLHMNDSLTDILFRENSSLEDRVHLVSGVNIDARVIDTAHHWSAVPLKLPTIGKRCH
jgi:hypothetical protein